MHIFSNQKISVKNTFKIFKLFIYDENIKQSIYKTSEHEKKRNQRRNLQAENNYHLLGSSTLMNGENNIA